MDGGEGAVPLADAVGLKLGVRVAPDDGELDDEAQAAVVAATTQASAAATTAALGFPAAEIIGVPFVGTAYRHYDGAAAVPVASRRRRRAEGTHHCSFGRKRRIAPSLDHPQ